VGEAGKSRPVGLCREGRPDEGKEITRRSRVVLRILYACHPFFSLHGSGVEVPIDASTSCTQYQLHREASRGARQRDE